MTEDHLRAAVAAERGDQADLLATLRPKQWDAPTLCDGWRVREVIAHTTMPFRTSLGRTLVELAKARGDVNRMADHCARRDAARLPAASLLASLRDNITHPWTPPGGGAHGALSHDVIHGLDITVALGLDRQVRTILVPFPHTRSNRWPCSSPRSAMFAPVASKIRKPRRPSMATKAKSSPPGRWVNQLRSRSKARST